MSSRAEQLRKFICSKHKGEKIFGDHDDIFESRLIDSLHFVEFTLFIEELSGKQIDVESINLDDFRTIATIEKVFFCSV